MKHDSPIVEADCVFFIVCVDFWLSVYDERCTQTVGVLTTKVTVVPVCSSLIARQSLYLISESLIWGNTALSDAYGSIEPGCRIEEHAMVMDSSVDIEPVRCVN